MQALLAPLNAKLVFDNSNITLVIVQYYLQMSDPLCTKFIPPPKTPSFFPKKPRYIVTSRDDQLQAKKKCKTNLYNPNRTLSLSLIYITIRSFTPHTRTRPIMLHTSPIRFNRYFLSSQLFHFCNGSSR
jgi:hypothetical protein